MLRHRLRHTALDTVSTALTRYAMLNTNCIQSNLYRQKRFSCLIIWYRSKDTSWTAGFGSRSGWEWTLLHGGAHAVCVQSDLYCLLQFCSPLLALLLFILCCFPSVSAIALRKIYSGINSRDLDSSHIFWHSNKAPLVHKRYRLAEQPLWCCVWRLLAVFAAKTAFLFFSLCSLLRDFSWSIFFAVCFVVCQDRAILFRQPL